MHVPATAQRPCPTRPTPSAPPRTAEPAPAVIRSEMRSYARTPAAAREVRRYAHWHLERWGLPDLIPPTELAASELVANAVVHGTGSEIAVALETIAGTGTVCVRVWDGSRAQPEQRGAGADDEQGRGLAIVEAVAIEWGAYRVSPEGKVTWAIVGEAEWAQI